MRSRVPGLDPRDIERVRRALESEEREAAQARMRAGRTLGKFPEGRAVSRGRVLDVVGRLAGVSGRTVAKIAELYAAEAAEPARYAGIVAEMERTGKIDGAHRKMKRAQDEARVLRLQPVAGRFRTLILDPAWEDESVSESQRPPYATMPLAAIAAVPVESWAMDQAHLYLWVTNAFVEAGCDLVRRWGFVRKTMLTWDKPAWGNGRYFRNQTEHVLFGVRGHLMTRSQAIATRFDGPIGEHSEKPEAFYDLVRLASYPPYGEAFQRRARPDFAGLYAPAHALEAAE